MKKLLTKTQIDHIQSSKAVIKVTNKTIQYTPSFKMSVLEASGRGESIRDVFERAGIPLAWLDKEYVRKTMQRWRKIARKHGTEHFKTEHRGGHTKKHSYKHMSDKDKVKHLEMKVEALEYIRNHFQLPPMIDWKPHDSRRRQSEK